MATHTPGPWTRIRTPGTQLDYIIGDKDVFIADIESSRAPARKAYKAPGEAAEANANLIAAAPRLLEMLKKLTTANKGSIPWAEVHTVIAEAEGRLG